MKATKIVNSTFLDNLETIYFINNDINKHYTMSVNSSGHKIYSVSRIYADANEIRPKEYWDYENYKISWGEINNYEIISKIGRGKYSEVFTGVNILNNKTCVIKVLKPVKLKKIDPT